MPSTGDAGRGGPSIGQTRTEVMVTYETATAVMPDEATIVHKVRMRIIPFVFLLYIISFLDRINIGFAALTMNKELAITAKQYGLVAGIFFFGYFLFEIPSNLLLHKLGARIWIARILVSWGIVANPDWLRKNSDSSVYFAICAGVG